MDDSMRVAVVTPFHQGETAWLRQCTESVAHQSYRNCYQVIVGDGVSLHETALSDGLMQLVLPRRVGDYGDSPRALGAIYAFSLGADAVTFLDSDNWYSEGHVGSLVRLHQATQAPVVASLRYLVSMEQEMLGVCPESNGLTFCDTNCMFFARSAAGVATSWWNIPPHLHVVDDREIWARVLRSRCSIARTLQASVYYRTAFRSHYEMFGRAAPESTRAGDEIRALMPSYTAEAESIIGEYRISGNGTHLQCSARLTEE